MPKKPENPGSSKSVSNKKSSNKESTSKPNRADAEAAASALRCYNSQDYRLEDPEFSSAVDGDSEADGESSSRPLRYNSTNSHRGAE